MIVCVTGPMAAGKNAVSALLEAQGWAAVDADVLVHEAAERLTPEICTAFSAEAAAAGIPLIKADGKLDRRALGTLIFPRPDLLARQESLVYPEINRLMDKFLAAHPDQNIALNATVLYKIPALMSRCTAVLFVTSPAALRFTRVRRRDHMPLRQICARFAAQRGLAAEYRKTGIPLITVHNSGSRAALSRTLSRILSVLTTLSSVSE